MIHSQLFVLLQQQPKTLHEFGKKNTTWSTHTSSHCQSLRVSPGTPIISAVIWMTSHFVLQVWEKLSELTRTVKRLLPGVPNSTNKTSRVFCNRSQKEKTGGHRELQMIPSIIHFHYYSKKIYIILHLNITCEEQTGTKMALNVQISQVLQ